MYTLSTDSRLPHWGKDGVDPTSPVTFLLPLSPSSPGSRRPSPLNVGPAKRQCTELDVDDSLPRCLGQESAKGFLALDRPPLATAVGRLFANTVSSLHHAARHLSAKHLTAFLPRAEATREYHGHSFLLCFSLIPSAWNITSFAASRQQTTVLTAPWYSRAAYSLDRVTGSEPQQAVLEIPKRKEH